MATKATSKAKRKTAGDRIIASLKSAVAYAKGDLSKGRMFVKYEGFTLQDESGRLLHEYFRLTRRALELQIAHPEDNVVLDEELGRMGCRIVPATMTLSEKSE